VTAMQWSALRKDMISSVLSETEPERDCNSKGYWQDVCCVCDVLGTCV
jgi:hypothetical protein